jgi:hypothetical protein
MSITLEQVLKMDLKSILLAIKNPETSADMQKLMGTRGSGVATRISALMLEAKQKEEELDAQLNRVVPPSTEELAAQATEMAAVPAQAIEVVPTQAVPVAKSYEEEDAEWKGAGVTITRDASGKATRYVEEYQVRDEDGTPIGRPTHLEARTLPELAIKKRDAHENATRAFHRLKKQKLTFKEKTLLTPEEIAEAARIALESKDTAKVTDVIHEVIETSYKEREDKLRAKIQQENGRAISNEFMRRHLHDYVPCTANSVAIDEYFRDHNLEFTLDNLEAAFQDLKEQGNKLAKVEPSATVPAVVAANPVAPAAVATPVTPAIPVVAETAATVPALETQAPPQAVVTPVVEATAPTSAAAHNAQPAARRPGVGGSIAPGSLSAQRPGLPDPALARKEFLKTVRDMDPKVMKAKLKNDPQFVKQLASYGIPVK